MSSGAGRGRGWLNLGHKSADAPKPGGLNLVNSSLSASAEPQVPAQYEELVKKIKDLNVNDDGIMFNRKIQQIQSCWEQTCATCEEVEQSFHSLHNLWLYDIDLGSKLVTLIALPSFMMQEIQECKIRKLLLEHLQSDFENGSQIQTKDPAVFRNCVHMLGEFYSRARLSNGATFRFLAEPFTKCLDLLLGGKNTQDYSLFTAQWYLNGSSLNSATPEEMLKLSLKIRTYLSTESLSKECKLWLLLALDIQNFRFGILTTDLYKFYENQLGNTAMTNFQRSHDSLCVQTVHPSKILDSYQSNVNVLQISSSPTESTTTTDISSFNSSSNDFQSELQQNSHLPTEMGTGNRKDKPSGRPILGTGARLNKNEENTAWNSKSNKNVSGGRPVTSKKGPPALKNNKAWEHDDRFDNDYS